jgi:hypothetical protein
MDIVTDEFPETYVELVDGRMVARDAEEWRLECLARHVLQLDGKLLRQGWLIEYERIHGNAEALKLKDRMTAVWAKERSS